MTRIVASLAVLCALAACETVEGAGQDIENAGQAISTEANDTQAEM
ncbi:entericidin A/B family lipoprotein [Pseudooceanicola sp. HF7]|nr:entericidin A/B family lipoprotein [Pseudooceanicola sp. HF7]NIZ08564.1 entericidin A/B family lipoprotein [Pseudooceanicola sp. HF7]